MRTGSLERYSRGLSGVLQASGRMTEESFDGCCSPSAKARGLYQMLGAGSTIEELRELIAVPPRIERVLGTYARMHAEDAHWIRSKV